MDRAVAASANTVPRPAVRGRVGSAEPTDLSDGGGSAGRRMSGCGGYVLPTRCTSWGSLRRPTGPQVSSPADDRVGQICVVDHDVCSGSRVDLGEVDPL